MKKAKAKIIGAIVPVSYTHLVIVVSGKAGVEVGTEKAWELCDKYNLPRMVYVTEMDMDDASFRNVVEELTARYGKRCV